MISTTHTLDGVRVKPGLRVWDYDLRRRIVGEPNRWQNPNEDTWYEMIIPDGPHAGQTGSTMNASRMWVRHPYTGETA